MNKQAKQTIAVLAVYLLLTWLILSYCFVNFKRNYGDDDTFTILFAMLITTQMILILGTMSFRIWKKLQRFSLKNMLSVYLLLTLSVAAIWLLQEQRITSDIAIVWSMHKDELITKIPIKKQISTWCGTPDVVGYRYVFNFENSDVTMYLLLICAFLGWSCWKTLLREYYFPK